MRRPLAGQNWTVFPDEHDSEDGSSSKTSDVENAKHRPLKRRKKKASTDEETFEPPAKLKRTAETEQGRDPKEEKNDREIALSLGSINADQNQTCMHGSKRCTQKKRCGKCSHSSKKNSKAESLREQSKYILIWEKNELQDMLLDFCYYFVLRIFDENSDERFKRDNPNHRYFKAYTRISDANTCILRSVLVSFQFKDDLMTVIRRHSQILWLQREELRSAEEKCETCGAKAWGVMQLQGNSYDPKTYKYLPKEEQSLEKPKLVLCKLHGTIASICFNLAQMRWSLNSNVEFRVKHVLKRHPSYSAEQVIDAINPDVFKKLAAYYLKFFVELDSYGSVNKSSSRKQRGLANQCLAWIRVVQRWKERAMRINRA